MDAAQLETRLLEVLRGEAAGRHAHVCFSGGLDSSVVLAACLRAGLPTTALLAVGPSLAEYEKQDAHALVKLLGADLVELDAGETEVAAYRANAGDRCYHCKTALYAAAEKLALAHFPQAWILNGAQVEDLADYRPGMDAAREHAVFAPLLEAGLDKAMVRALAHAWDLPIADKAASPCLASRFPVGTEVTPERLRRVDAVESYLRANGLWPARARFHGPVVRVELERRLMPKALEEPYRSELEAVAKAAGFAFVALDLTGLQTGSLSFALDTAGQD
jgi:pyridinium-3,5-biscarboxylic acid mononucleotide sulfurtransferase